MKKRQERIERIKSVEREYQAAAVAAELLAEKLRSEPSFLAPTLRARDGEVVRQSIETAFLIRLFAVFEAGLREVWSEALRQTTEPRMKDLVDALTARRGVPQGVADAVHQVREYRNALLHGGETSSVSIGDARRQLNRFFARLPEDW